MSSLPDVDIMCAICLDPSYPPFVLPCTHVFCYMCIKHVAETHRPCPMCNALIPRYVLEGARISEDILNLADGSGKWMYSGRRSGWWYFTPEIDEIIETSWKNHTEQGGDYSVVVVILGRNYSINFNTMTQSSAQGMTRNIKRVEVGGTVDGLVKGISGLRIVKKDDLPMRMDL